MKTLKRKLSAVEWIRNNEKKSNYKKFVKTTLSERRKQNRIHPLNS